MEIEYKTIYDIRTRIAHLEMRIGRLASDRVAHERNFERKMAEMVAENDATMRSYQSEIAGYEREADACKVLLQEKLSNPGPVERCGCDA